MKKIIISADSTIATSNVIVEVTSPCTITYAPSSNDSGVVIKNTSGGDVVLSTPSVLPGSKRNTIDGVYEITLSDGENTTVVEVGNGEYESISYAGGAQLEKLTQNGEITANTLLDTEAEYTALGDVVLTNGVMYYIAEE